MVKWFLLLKLQRWRMQTHMGDFSQPKGTGEPPRRRCAAGSLSSPSSHWEAVQGAGNPGDTRLPACPRCVAATGLLG